MYALAAAYKEDVVAVVVDRRALNGWIKANPPMIEGTEGYAGAQRAKLAGQAPVSPEQEAQIRSLRQEAAQRRAGPIPEAELGAW